MNPDQANAVESLASSSENGAGRFVQPYLKSPQPDDARVKEVVSVLRRFHLGDPAAAAACEGPEDDCLPALLNTYRHVRRFRYEYPLVLFPVEAGQDKIASSLDEFLRDSVESFAGSESAAKILKDNLSWLEHYVREQMTGRELPVAALALIQEAADALRDHLALSGSNRDALDADLESLIACVSPKAMLLAFSPNTAFHLLHHVLSCYRAVERRAFQVKLADRVRSLKQLLEVEQERTAATDASQLSSRVGEASRYLNANSFSGVVKHRNQGAVGMSEARLARVRRALEALERFYDDEGDRVHLVVRPGSLTMQEGDAFRITESDNPSEAALALYDELAAERARVFAAVRIAALEIEDKYDAAVHDSWFEHFDWEAFSDEELRLMPAVVAVETTTEAAGEQMHAVSRLLNSGKPVQIAMTVSAHGNPEQDGDDPLHKLRMELAYFGIGHREAVINQVSCARVDSLISGFSCGLESTRPAMHLIHTGFTAAQPLHPWIMASAALESRAHPGIRFNPAFVGGGQIDFADNPAADEDWPTNEFSYLNDQDESVTTELKFTFADYCLLKPDLRQHFKLVPEDCDSEDLVNVDEYLAAEGAEQDRMIPCVLGVAGDGAVRKLVVSRMLMFACRDRLGFWRDLQAMAGIHNFYVDQAVARVREEEQARAAEDLEALRAEHEQKLEEVRTTAAEDIMGRLTDVLLGLDLSDVALRGGGSAAPAPAPTEAPSAEPPAEEAGAEAAPEAEQPAEEEEEDDISFDEPWIDSMLCTSCDDCMAINKVLFVYNEDKQAMISDPKSGTYEDLVRAAEACPAKCIHPGKPLDSSEPNIEELIKRAEPFN